MNTLLVVEEDAEAIEYFMLCVCICVYNHVCAPTDMCVEKARSCWVCHVCFCTTLIFSEKPFPMPRKGPELGPGQGHKCLEHYRYRAPMGSYVLLHY